MSEGGTGKQLLDVARAMERFRFTTTRPVAVLMVFLAVMVFGGFSVRMLPLNLMPDISYPKLTVRTEYPGAAPAEVEHNVSRPLEEILGVVTGLTRIESISRAGYSDVILEFTWDTDMDDANQDVLEKIDTVKPALPEDVKQPLILRYDPTLDPVLTVSVSGSGVRYDGIAGLKRLRRIADRDVRRLLEPIEGVAAVKVKGGLEEEIHVELDEDQLRRTRISIATVIQRLAAENINLAGGSMKDGRTRYMVRTVNEFASLEDIREIIVVSQGGRDIKLRHLGSVASGYKDRDVITRVNGNEAVEVEVYKEAESNIVDMAARVREQIDERVRRRLEREHEAEIRVVSDRSSFIESSIMEVRNTAIFGGTLAVIVLFLFLRDFKSTAIVAVSIPISVLVAFAPLKLAGVSLNIMSLGGLALGIGMLVDNSIVVLESIHRCREEGDEVVRATVRGTAEVGSAVTASTLTSIAVFFPMVFVEGVAGQMFGDLGLAVVFSLLASLAVALFFIPMLASRRALVIGPGSSPSSLGAMWAQWTAFKEARSSFGAVRWWHFAAALLPFLYIVVRSLLHLVFELVAKLVGSVLVVVVLVFGVIFVALHRVLVVVLKPLTLSFGWVLGRLETLYPPVIRWSLRNRVVVYLLSLATLGAMALGASRLDSELIPELHQGEFTVEVNLPVGSPLERTDEIVKPLEQKLIDQVPLLRTITATIGSERDNSESSDRGEHTARLRLTLGHEVEASDEGPRRSRDPVALEAGALAVVRDVIDDVPDMTHHISRPVLFSFKSPIEVEVRGYDLDELRDATEAVRDEVTDVPGLRDVKASIQPGSPEIQIVYDRDALARHDLDIRRVAELVRDKVHGSEATQYNRKDRKIPVRVRLEGITEATMDELRDLVVNPGAPRPVPLGAVAELSLGRGPSEVRRIGQQRVGLVTGNLEGVGLGSVAERIRAKLAAIDTLPPAMSTALTGQSEEWETSERSLYFALVLSIFLVYVIMASQFESLVYPLIILVTIPLAFAGVVGVLVALDLAVSVVVFIGAIMLSGIVVNNAIVLVDYVNRLKSRGHPTAEAVELAGRVRLRPILMTTLTTVLGLLPMALGLGDGAEIRMPMAITVIAGLAFSTLLTLVVIPTLYSGIDRFKRSPAGGGDALEREIAGVEPSMLEPRHDPE